MKTYEQLIHACQNIIIDPSTVDFDGIIDTETFIKREINATVRHIFTLMRQYKLEPPAHTFNTVANTAEYNLPLSTLSVDTVTAVVNGIKIDLKPVYSQNEYNLLTSYPNPAGWPTRFFVERGKIKLFPVPQGAYTATVTYSFTPKPMTEDDVDDGTATIVTSSGETTVTLSSSVVTAGWEGRFFALTNSDGEVISKFHKIEEVESSTEFVLERPFEDGDGSTLAYVVGQSVEMPEALFDYIPYRVGSVYYMTRKKEPKTAQKFNNMYFTGDPDNGKRSGNIMGGILYELNELKNKGRDNKNIVETAGGNEKNAFSGIWSINVPS